MNNNKFKSDPYNKSNFLITEKDVFNIVNNYNIKDFKINDIKLYQKAFTHKSYCHMKDYEEYKNTDNCLELQEVSYETMEFLGDSILGYIICEYIYKRYTLIYNQDEGFLTRLKNRLVNGETLAYIADKLNFNKYLIISKHIDDNHNGRNNKNILEDSFEAFIGAIYLDTNDISLVKEFLINIYEKYINFTDIIVNNTNYKDQLLRYFQNNFKEYPKNFKEYPKYDVTEVEINNLFKCKVLKGDEIISEGIGQTKKKSEQDASKNALCKFGVLN
jgi:ribonuclease-3